VRQTAGVPDRTAEIAATYDALAARWDEWAGAVTPSFREPEIDWLASQLRDRSTVIELGCGTGSPVGVELAASHRYVGVDLSAAMLERARRATRGRDAAFLRADIADVSFGSGSADAVVALFSIIHVPRDLHARTFAAIRGWLRPGGWFVAGLGARDDPGEREPCWLGAGPMHWSGFAADHTCRLLEQSGFRLAQADVRAQQEDGEEVRFLWVRARAV
jgi:SAM-dependent methyltransferase